jgi:hypothetical protein
MDPLDPDSQDVLIVRETPHTQEDGDEDPDGKARFISAELLHYMLQLKHLTHRQARQLRAEAAQLQQLLHPHCTHQQLEEEEE